MSKTPNEKTETKKAAVEKFDVELIASHTHAGRERKAGETISVNARQKQFLIDNKKIAG